MGGRGAQGAGGVLEEQGCYEWNEFLIDMPWMAWRMLESFFFVGGGKKVLWDMGSRRLDSIDIIV